MRETLCQSSSVCTSVDRVKIKRLYTMTSGREDVKRYWLQVLAMTGDEASCSLERTKGQQPDPDIDLKACVPETEEPRNHSVISAFIAFEGGYNGQGFGYRSVGLSQTWDVHIDAWRLNRIYSDSSCLHANATQELRTDSIRFQRVTPRKDTVGEGLPDTVLHRTEHGNLATEYRNVHSAVVKTSHVRCCHAIALRSGTTHV
ncbi:hypothetical protein PHSY_003391 [Pseudozyma hubeiensis SY62]|uniref:Uncharacterized protein n=1 Tax=Pseudozyma hubeiensis (strain SY62) TaxID=1305764 RepID=R9P3E7_PSEHS|nr:hypothetical protein PHSY_003391 [Pseudozyma hubeiensis SY62]GAC95814.1 hypothetical protein PHSY_003391 [Pseudozyma hubeiensis SY62]